jgi:hypothetical protein
MRLRADPQPRFANSQHGYLVAAAATASTTTAAVTTTAAAVAATTTAAAHTAAAATSVATTTAAAGRTADTLEAVAAVDGPVTTGLERHLGGLAALAANDVEQLALGARCPVEAATTATRVATIAVHAALRAAVAATLGLAETARCIELLVVRGKRERLVAIHAR